MAVKVKRKAFSKYCVRNRWKWRIDNLKRRIRRGSGLLKTVTLTVLVCFFLGYGIIRLRAGIVFGKEYQPNYIYIKTSLAKQTPIDELFTFNRTEDQIIPNESETLHEYIKNLHIEEYDTDKKGITYESILRYEDKAKAIYKNGNEPRRDSFDVDSTRAEELATLRKELVNWKDKSFEGAIREAEGWKELFDTSNLPADIYQSQRALKDSLELLCGGSDFNEILKVASNAILRSEIFLRFADRNIYRLSES